MQFILPSQFTHRDEVSPSCSVTNLTSEVGAVQRTTLDDPTERRKHKRLDVTLDEIQSRFGSRAISRANSPRKRGRPS